MRAISSPVMTVTELATSAVGVGIRVGLTAIVGSTTGAPCCAAAGRSGDNVIGTASDGGK